MLDRVLVTADTPPPPAAPWQLRGRPTWSSVGPSCGRWGPQSCLPCSVCHTCTLPAGHDEVPEPCLSSAGGRPTLGCCSSPTATATLLLSVTPSPADLLCFCQFLPWNASLRSLPSRPEPARAARALWLPPLSPFWASASLGGRPWGARLTAHRGGPRVPGVFAGFQPRRPVVAACEASRERTRRASGTQGQRQQACQVTPAAQEHPALCRPHCPLLGAPLGPLAEDTARTARSPAA